MARKLQLISELADRTAHEVTQSEGAWKQYLDTASRLYKYRFDDQLLIYAQRPNATACAQLELWNEKMHRWVKAGSKGIALIRGVEDGRPHLEHVFDVADTRPVRGARMPYLWEMRKEHHESVLAALEGQYGKVGRKELGDGLMEIAARAVREACPEHLRELSYDRKGSSLEGPAQPDLEACFRNTLTASVQYALLTRCGLDASAYLEDGKLAGITRFSTPAALHHLGDAVSILSMGILQEIGKAVRKQDLERVAEGQRNIPKTAEKPLAKPADIGYTEATEQFNTLKCESEEGREDHGGTDIQQERGLPDTGSGAGRGGRDGRDAPREVRDAAADISSGEPSRDIHVHAADRQAPAAPAGDRQAGPGAGGRDGGGDDEAEGRGRGPERAGSDGLAAGGQQFHGPGGGSGAAGDRVPVRQEEQEEIQETAGGEPAVSAPGYVQMSLFPTVEEQAERMSQAEEETKETDQVFMRGSGVSEGKMRICSYFMRGHTAKERADFLKNEYGNGGHISSGYSVQYDSKGIRVTRSENASGFQKDKTVKMNWSQAQKRIGELIAAGKYLNPKEMAYRSEYEKKQLARSIYQFYYNCPTPRRPGGSGKWDAEAPERDYRPMLEDARISAILYEDMRESFASVMPDESRGYRTMQRALEDMSAFQRGEYSLFKPLPEAALQAERMEREEAKKEAEGKGNIPREERKPDFQEEKEPVGELEAIARSLAKKQKGNLKEKAGGQLAFDFSAEGAEDAADAEAVPKEPDSGLEQTREPEAIQAGGGEKAPAVEPAPSIGATEENAGAVRTEKGLIPNVEEYLNLKVQYPDKLVGVQVGKYVLFYGKDAQAAAPALSAKLLTREIPGLGETYVTGGRAWQTVLKKLLEHGHSVVIAGQNPERGSNAPYEIIKERDIADYIPLGMELTIDGRRMEVDSVDYGKGYVELRDLKLRGWLPVFRKETVAFVRECVEREQEKSKTPNPDRATVSDHEKEAADRETEPAAAKAPQLPDSPEMQEAKSLIQDFVLEEYNEDSVDFSNLRQVGIAFYDAGLPYEIGIQKLSIGPKTPAEPERQNFRITDEALGTGGQKTKFQRNLEAIHTLKQIEAEKRLATPKEQEILSRYVGWGGLPQAFDAGNEKWGKEYGELKELLTPGEYESARGTVLNAHYTSPIVIHAMYEAVKTMDYTPGNILEPSCGIGNFFGLVPEEFQKSRLYGVELDSLTGRIAGQLYQKADITVGGFETTEYPDDFFDLAVGNGSVLFRLNAKSPDFMRVCGCLAYKIAA